MLKVLEHSTVYRNPQPNRVSEYVSFPSIQALPDDTLLCMCQHGTARESDDTAVKIHRSTDGGRTWQPAGCLPQPSARAVGHSTPAGLGIAPDGDVVAWARYPEAANNSQAHTCRSSDGGLNWSQPVRLDPSPFEGLAPSGNLATLPDGTMVAVAETWRQAADPKLPQWWSLLTRSFDGGRTWEPIRIVHESKDPYLFDLRITALADGRLLGAYWTHDMRADKGLNVHTTWSQDAGATWTDPHDTRFWGQVTNVCALRSGRVIAVTNHRRPPLGVRALLSSDGGATFEEQEHLELWGIEPATVRSAPVLADRRDVVEDALAAYHHFTFGTPTVTQLSDGTIVAAFYVSEEHVTYVRCCRMREG